MSASPVCTSPSLTIIPGYSPRLLTLQTDSTVVRPSPGTPPPFKDYLDSKQVEENRVWPIFLFDLACAKSIILANSVGNPQRNSHFKCLFYKKNIKISIRYEVYGSLHLKYK